MLVDVHCHLNDDKLKDNLENVLKNAENNGIKKMICVGCDIPTSILAVEIATKYDNVYACIGIHPEYADDFSAKDLEILESLASNKKVVGIGEIGLDYHYEPFSKENQKYMFIEQLKLAHKLNLPIQVHTRDATQDTMDILKQNKDLLTNKGIIHCYSGSMETLREIKNLGFKISMGGILTFKNARTTVELAEKMPLDMIMFETDCPYLSPVPYRSETNEPKNVLYVAQKFSEIRNINLENLINISYNNVLEIFKNIK